MTRGRKPSPAAVDTTAPALNTEALASANRAMTELGRRSAEIAERFGDGLAYDRERVVHEARFLMAQSAEAMLEAGKRLIQIKENEPHGEFMRIVDEQLGLGERAARLMMQAAAKYLLSPALEGNRQTFAVLGKAKLFDLMVESDEDLQELAEGGTLAGKTLDELKTLSVRDMRAELKKARQDSAAKQKVIDKKNKENDTLRERLASPFQPSEESAAADAEQQAALDELRDASLAAELAMRRLAIVATEVLNSSWPEAMHKAASSSVEYVCQRVADITTEHSLPVQFEEMIRPDWLDVDVLQAKGKAKAK